METLIITPVFVGIVLTTTAILILAYIVFVVVFGKKTAVNIKVDPANRTKL
jgi:hypothetical protein